MYLSELKKVTNNESGNTFFYVLICGVWTRISKDDYDQRIARASRQDSFQTVMAGKYVYQFSTCYYK